MNNALPDLDYSKILSHVIEEKEAELEDDIINLNSNQRDTLVAAFIAVAVELGDSCFKPRSAYSQELVEDALFEAITGVDGDFSDVLCEKRTLVWIDPRTDEELGSIALAVAKSDALADIVDALLTSYRGFMESRGKELPSTIKAAFAPLLG